MASQSYIVIRLVPESPVDGATFATYLDGLSLQVLDADTQATPTKGEVQLKGTLQNYVPAGTVVSFLGQSASKPAPSRCPQPSSGHCRPARSPRPRASAAARRPLPPIDRDEISDQIRGAR